MKRFLGGMIALGVAIALIAVGCSSDQQPEQGATVPASSVDEAGHTTDSADTDTGQTTDDPDTDTGAGQDTVPQAPPPIRIDQFGYRPGDPKIAVLADPQTGYDADVSYEPGQVIEVRRASDEEVVHEGAPTIWAEGAEHELSGDRGWWFDFSSVQEPGTYYLADPANEVTTGEFEIGDDVYDDVLDAALRMFWYNRANTAHPEEFAGPWSDEAAYAGPDQDAEARWVDDQTNDATALDLSGGWFDAGDANKYVTFASEPVHLLLTAYRRHPEVFDDSVGIPESGNGIPDVIDEVRWELDWLRRMQMDDGGVLTKVGLIETESSSTPSESDLARYYEEVCSSSTIAAAGMFAHAAFVLASFPTLAEESADLQDRARQAWDWYNSNSKRDDCDAQIVRAGDADMSIEEQHDAAVVAAIYLFALTGDDEFQAVVGSGFAATLPMGGGGFGNYGPDQSEALLFYRDLASAEPTTVAVIDRHLSDLRAESKLLGFTPEADLYRAAMPDSSYHWGSNMVMANIGSSNLAIADVAGGYQRALAHLQYFHGVNPLGLVYLSNMGAFGAERSVQSLFHFWFGEGSPYDVGAGSEIGVAPGFVAGGPNMWYSGEDVPPADQPPQKSYRDWSAYGSEPSWEITEPAIYYQAAYVRLLAAVLAT